MMEMVHQYEDVTKFQQKGEANLEEESGDHESIATPTESACKQSYDDITAVVKTLTKSQDPPTDSYPPPESKSSKSETQNDFDCTECVAYKSNDQVPWPPTTPHTEDDPVYCN